MHLPAQITPRQHAGHSALQLTTRHGTAIIALHGAHLLSWTPTGQRDVLWLSPEALPEPAAIRGGVPVCWPWFAKQGMPASALQHGPARVLPWQVSAIHASSDDEISLSLVPCAQATGDASSSLAELAPGLQVSLRITLGETLSQTLHTRNLGSETFQLTQALHSYFAVSHAAQVGIEGLIDLPYLDKLLGMTTDVQQVPFALDVACDRIYHAAQKSGDSFPGRYTLTDPAWQRRLVIETEGSQSVVVWNPGREGARSIADVPNDGWQDFFCIEAANAGPDGVTLAPGAEHRLGQTLSIK
ncbi:D-hexose-6-phosphate mutarotase [Polaromonas naphthalenivorans]|uniref:Putative glucose-6-phosphate 1-epimerase n=1 Tax=Polaromonas naphthalenivorans (strain CJ2) TaxID=365044 RepID=A1VNA8_POLNA|nr:D-hexose-6-phosphate mutarotase [Polaromonas naphthalenivorans]ABM37136.1 Aldose 1-epimerase [Polaromonas naphthalenivorans CJ2]